MKTIVNFKSHGMRVFVLLGTLIACTIIFSPPLVCANPCGDYDYSELKDMSIPELEDTYCKELKTTRLYIKLSMYRNTRQIEVDKDSCMSTVGKIERAYMKKTNNKITHDALMDKCQEE